MEGFLDWLFYHIQSLGYKSLYCIAIRSMLFAERCGMEGGIKATTVLFVVCVVGFGRYVFVNRKRTLFSLDGMTSEHR